MTESENKTDPAMRAVDCILMHLPISEQDILPEHRTVIASIIRRETRCDEISFALDEIIKQWSTDEPGSQFAHIHTEYIQAARRALGPERKEQDENAEL